MKTIFENRQFKLIDNEQNFDFVGLIENKTNRTIKVELEEDLDNGVFEDTINIPAKDWIGFVANDTEIAEFEQLITRYNPKYLKTFRRNQK